jgi:hypothetical protein
MGPDTTPHSGPRAVIEIEGQPLLYIAEAATLGSAGLPPLRRLIACRGDAPYVGVLEPGRLVIYEVGLDTRPPEKLEDVLANEPVALSLIPTLALDPAHRSSRESEAIHDLLFRLLDEITEQLTHLGISPHDALSLSGRAMFLRFLLDRGIVRPKDITQVCPSASSYADCFADALNSTATCSWLDRTFNGNLLPLSPPPSQTAAWFQYLGGPRNAHVFTLLSRIVVVAEPSGQMRLDLDWGGIDFGHVPVGLLSQVYERHSHRFNPSAKEDSIHYTPRLIADYMIKEAFAALPEPHAARVLDPAVGAGVFLVSAFRQLVAERWRHEGRRPDTATIRSILYNQLAGFEINEPALRLTALSLYLTALELDPAPSPLSKLGFDDLQTRVLQDVSDVDSRVELGSLGPRVPKRHNRSYHLVVGNPPWTAKRRKPEVRAALLRELHDVATERLGRAEDLALPDDVPDLAFIWRSLSWLRPGGVLAFAVHGRLLFKQSPLGGTARKQLFEALRVTGILNGAALRNTPVWPGVTAPFALLFARNETPRPTDLFYYVSPEIDDRLNRSGRYRIDAKAAQRIRCDAVQDTPTLFKTLFRGTALDVSVVERLSSKRTVPLGMLWKKLGLKSGKGFQIGGTARPPQDATFLHDLPELTRRSRVDGVVLDTSALLPFEHERILYPRNREIYRAPLVLFPVSPASSRKGVAAFLSFKDVAYSESFVGFSSVTASEAESLARYLHLVLSSDLLLYHALMTSSQFGVERDALLKEDIERFPIVPFDSLASDQQAGVVGLSQSIASRPGANAPRDEIGDLLARIYDLRKADLDIIRDTLTVGLPFASTRRVAQKAPTSRQREAFCDILERELRGLFGRFGVALCVVPLGNAATEPWLRLSVYDKRTPPPDGNRVTEEVMRSANEFGASQIVSVDSRGRALHLALLNQYRYWTPSRARLCAMTLAEEFGALLTAKSS